MVAENHFLQIKLAVTRRRTKPLLSKVRTCEREDPDDEDDHRDPAVGEVVVPGVGVDDGPPPVDGDDDDRERRHQDVGACRKKCSS